MGSDAEHKHIGIKKRFTDHRQNFAVIRIHHHDGAGFITQGIAGGLLQATVDR